jgi:hypothetical protein
VDADRRRVEVEDHTLWSCACLPGPFASDRSGLANPFDLALINGQQHPPRGGDRGHFDEQRRLAREDRQVRDAPSAVGGHDCQVTEHVAGIVR